MHPNQDHKQEDVVDSALGALYDARNAVVDRTSLEMLFDYVNMANDKLLSNSFSPVPIK